MNQTEEHKTDEGKHRVSVLQNDREVMSYDVTGEGKAHSEASFWARHLSALPLVADPMQFVNVERSLAVRAYALDADREQSDLNALLAHYREVVRTLEEKAADIRTVTEVIGCGRMHALPIPERAKPTLTPGLWAVRWNDLDRLHYGDLVDTVFRIAEVSKSGKTVTLDHYRVLASDIAGTFLTKEEAEKAIEHSKLTNVMVTVLEHARTADLVSYLNESQAALSADLAIKAAA